VAYVHAPDRTAARPLAHLSAFACVLQVDGYSGYRALADANQVTLAFCWAHVRRRFYHLATAVAAPIAGEALTRIAELYRIESEIRGMNAAEWARIRQTKSRSILEAGEPCLCGKLSLISQKSKMAEAIRYALVRWDVLSRIVTGHLNTQIDDLLPWAYAIAPDLKAVA
jgi:hypothetical protein